MNRTIRASVGAVAVACLAFGLGACSAAERVDKAVNEEIDEAVGEEVDKVINETYEVTYEVTGKNIDSIDFHAGGGDAMNPKIETVEKPTLPWKRTVTLRGIMPPVVTPIAVDPAGTEVNCKIIYKGDVIKEASGEGLAAGGGCIAVSPIVK
ncbi:MmpS family transport accessory protein [Streptomyces sp. AK02-01A]|uniref:MmpS family transport accessory protein n=1 Tax=Streptomyces sp. AK02-01A TaxID=3028648 RepID=UPI0029B05044|nr:MmpS family transport accessory protein [Streptomyces sp. AK02-01A]MDX3852230.1 MmpS family transport accessory protein [Streptomyces sp. AK02-01A]